MTDTKTGWITLHRKINKHWLWDSKPFSYGQAWVDMLLECNHSEHKKLMKKKLVITKRGQSSNSLKTWANRWGWSLTATRHFLELLKNDMMISTENIHVTTLLTILNYDAYQAKPHADDTQEDFKEIPSESQEGYKQQVNNGDNGNNGNNGVLRAHESFRKISTKKPTQHELYLITQLTFAHDLDDVIKAIEVTGENGWHSVATVKKVLSGELPKKAKGGIVIMKDPQEGKR